MVISEILDVGDDELLRLGCPLRGQVQLCVTVDFFLGLVGLETAQVLKIRLLGTYILAMWLRPRAKKN